MTYHPGSAPQPAPPRRSRRFSRDQAAMLTVAISVCAILGAMVFLGVRELPDALAEPAPEPVPLSATDAPESEDAEEDDEESQQPLEYTTTEEAAADPDSPEGVAALWYEANINSDLDGFEPLTCENPTSAVIADLQWAQNHEPDNGDYTVSNIYATSRERDGAIEVAIFLIADDPAYDYIWAKESRPGDIINIMTVVEEDGEWRVCDQEGFM